MPDIHCRAFRLTFLWGVIPTLVIYLPFLTKQVIGICFGPVVFIHNSYAQDESTLVHELEHCKQFWSQGLVIHFLRYCLSQSYRLSCEIEAYAAELIYTAQHLDDVSIQVASQTIGNAYKLGYAPEFIQSKMRHELRRRSLYITP
jgi:hypothetical protein